MLRYRPGVALVIVDVQNDFADSRGSLAVRGAADIIPVINGEATLARSNGTLVVLTQDWHPPRTPHFIRDGGPWPPHCVMDTWGAELHPALDDPQGTAIVRKGSNGEDGYSAFTMRDADTGNDVPTMLQPLLQTAGVEDVVIVGLATDYACGQRRSTRSAWGSAPRCSRMRSLPSTWRGSPGGPRQRRCRSGAVVGREPHDDHVFDACRRQREQSSGRACPVGVGAS